MATSPSKTKAKKSGGLKQKDLTAAVLGDIALFRPAYDLLEAAEAQPNSEELALIGMALWQALEHEQRSGHHRGWVQVARTEGLRG